MFVIRERLYAHPVVVVIIVAYLATKFLAFYEDRDVGQCRLS
jgi:hypothetical protein